MASLGKVGSACMTRGVSESSIEDWVETPRAGTMSSPWFLTELMEKAADQACHPTSSEMGDKTVSILKQAGTRPRTSLDVGNLVVPTLDYG